ncbi:MAG TPA: T9SS type A sorting domain-containing protein, partial [Flavobacterium sp.]
ISGNVIANVAGIYELDVPPGAHTITPILENLTYFTVSPSSYSATFPAQPSPMQQDFCVVANGVHPDLEITLLPLTSARPGFPSDYRLVCQNKGTVVQSGTITFEYPEATTDLTSSAPVASLVSPGLLSWNYTDFLPFETRIYNISLIINTPMDTPPVNDGDQLDFDATINPISGDETPGNNVSPLKQFVVNSFDPNDKTCLEGNTVAPEMIGEYVHYMIRFENTGTYAAQNIVVKDMVDTSKFDVSTLIPISGSHPFETRISATNKVEFIFENIMLPFDDATNDGYVAFKIKTLPTLIVGDTFSNNANIYFDYNFPIITNTAATTIEELGINDFEFAEFFTLYPNPTTNTLNIKCSNSVAISSISFYNTLGQLLLLVSDSSGISTIDVSDLKAGNYFVKIDSDKGSSTGRFVKN